MSLFADGEGLGGYIALDTCLLYTGCVVTGVIGVTGHKRCEVMLVDLLDFTFYSEHFVQEPSCLVTRNKNVEMERKGEKVKGTTDFIH